MNSKISINLLPPEDALAKWQARRQRFIQTVSASAILVMLFLTSTLISLKILQNRTLSEIQSQAAVDEGIISRNRSSEETLVLLKDRLNLIDKLTEGPSKQRLLYELIMGKIPSLYLSSVSVDDSGNLTLTVVMDNPLTLANFFSSLTTEEVFNKVASIDVENLSRGRDGIYRASLKLTSEQ